MTASTNLTERLADGEENAKGQLDEQRDVTILRSLPGVGRIVLATLLAEATDALRRRDYHALRSLSGVAPVTKRSGKSKIVLMRQAAHVRLRNAVYHWARTAVQHDQRSRVKYAALRARGHGHGRALRSIAATSSSAAERTASSWTSASVTAAPASAKALAVARPMPEAAPVTSATLSLKDQFTDALLLIASSCA